jgi:hypothetical protein
MMESLLTDWVCVIGRPQGTLSLRQDGVRDGGSVPSPTSSPFALMMSCVAAGPSPYQSEIRGLGSALGVSPVSVKSCGFRNFCGTILWFKQSAPGSKSTASSGINLFELISGYIFK